MFKINASRSYRKYIFLSLLMVVIMQSHAMIEVKAGDWEEYMIEQIRYLEWKTEPGKYQLTGVNASVTTTSEEYLLVGKDAHKYQRITEGHDLFKPDAVVVRVKGPNQATKIAYTYHEIGFVKMDDWDEHINANALLNEIKRNTEAANKIKEKGYPNFYIDGWVQEPFLDKDNAVVYCAISMHTDEGSSIVNASTMKLGRKGFTEMVWVGTLAQFINAQTSLLPALAAYQYDEGSKYADFVPGTDTVATAGAGALAYKLITGKTTAKVGVSLLALLAVFAKKLWFLVFIPFIFVWKRLKVFFTRAEDEDKKIKENK